MKVESVRLEREEIKLLLFTENVVLCASDLRSGRSDVRSIASVCTGREEIYLYCSHRVAGGRLVGDGDQWNRVRSDTHTHRCTPTMAPNTQTRVDTTHHTHTLDL